MATRCRRPSMINFLIQFQIVSELSALAVFKVKPAKVARKRARDTKLKAARHLKLKAQVGCVG